MATDSNPKVFVCVGAFVTRPVGPRDAPVTLPTKHVWVMPITQHDAPEQHFDPVKPADPANPDGRLIPLDFGRTLDSFRRGEIPWEQVTMEGVYTTVEQIGMVKITDQWPKVSSMGGLSSAGRVYLQVDFADKHAAALRNAGGWPTAEHEAGQLLSLAYRNDDGKLGDRYIGFRARLAAAVTSSLIQVNLIRAGTNEQVAAGVEIDLADRSQCDTTFTEVTVLGEAHTLRHFQTGDPVGTYGVVLIHLGKAAQIAAAYPEFAGPKLPFWMG